MTWPISWPDTVAEQSLDPNIKALAELYADRCMTALTLGRVGGDPITLMPTNAHRVEGYYAGWLALDDEYPLGTFYPGLVYPSVQDLQTYLRLDRLEAIDLPGPVGAVTEVKVGGVVLPASAYRVEDGRWLVRIDGGTWPSVSGDEFTVSYHQAHPVGAMGAHAGGVMAEEWVKLFTRAKGGCRLPASVTSVSRQGLNYTLTPGMFPGGVTGIPEIDAYLMLWNPHGLKVRPAVYSPDLAAHRQVTS